MLPDELDDRGRVFQSVRVMLPSWLANQFDLTSQLRIAICDQPGVLFPGNRFIRVAKNMQQRHLGVSQRLQIVDRIPLVGDRFVIVLEFPKFSGRAQFLGLPGPFPFPPGQLLKSQTGASA